MSFNRKLRSFRGKRRKTRECENGESYRVFDYTLNDDDENDDEKLVVVIINIIVVILTFNTLLLLHILLVLF